MTRIRGAAARPLAFEEEVELVFGEPLRWAPTTFENDEDRAAVWRAHRDSLMEWCRTRPGDRPWAHWRFDLCEEQPVEHADQVVRLAELGELTAEQRAELAERAAVARCDLEAEWWPDDGRREREKVIVLHERVTDAVDG